MANPILVSEFSMVKYDVLGNSFVSKCEEALVATEVLLSSVQDKASIIFENIVLSRTTLHSKSIGVVSHNLVMSICEGPFTSKEFMEMMQYDRSMSNDQWYEYNQMFNHRARDRAK